MSAEGVIHSKVKNWSNGHLVKYIWFALSGDLVQLSWSGCVQDWNTDSQPALFAEWLNHTKLNWEIETNGETQGETHNNEGDRDMNTCPFAVGWL